MFQPETSVNPQLSKDFLPPLINAASVRMALILSALYLFLSYILIGFRSDQVVLVVLFNTLYFSSRVTRRLVIGLSIFIIYWIIFDWMKAFPNYKFNEVHIASLYNLEKELFGINFNGAILTPNEYFNQTYTTGIDILAGLFYICWIPVPLLFAGAMFFRNRKIFFQFSLAFFVVNLVGWSGYYGYPAAPPWYVAQYGFDFIAHTPGNTGGLARFDAIVGSPVFASIYSKSSNVFAAMPSLHSAYMLIVLYYGIKARLGWYNLLFAVIMGGIWFTAVYSSHHYVLDVLFGILAAIIGISIFELALKKAWMQNFVDRLMQLTGKNG